MIPLKFKHYAGWLPLLKETFKWCECEKQKPGDKPDPYMWGTKCTYILILYDDYYCSHHQKIINSILSPLFNGNMARNYVVLYMHTCINCDGHLFFKQGRLYSLAFSHEFNFIHKWCSHSHNLTVSWFAAQKIYSKLSFFIWKRGNSYRTGNYITTPTTSMYGPGQFASNYQYFQFYLFFS